MVDLKAFGGSCFGVFIAFACLRYFFVRNDHVVLRRTRPPVLA